MRCTSWIRLKQGGFGVEKVVFQRFLNPPESITSVLGEALECASSGKQPQFIPIERHALAKVCERGEGFARAFAQKELGLSGWKTRD
jgi:hypothetical protein